MKNKPEKMKEYCPECGSSEIIDIREFSVCQEFGCKWSRDNSKPAIIVNENESKMKTPQEIRKILDVYFEPLETETWYKNNREQLISDLVNCFVENKVMQEYAEQYHKEKSIDNEKYLAAIIDGCASQLAKQQQEAKEDMIKFEIWKQKNFNCDGFNNSGELIYVSILGMRFYTLEQLYDRYKKQDN